MSKLMIMYTFVNNYERINSKWLSSSFFMKTRALHTKKRQNDGCKGKKILTLDTMHEGTSKLGNMDFGNMKAKAKQIKKDICKGKRNDFRSIIEVDSCDLHAAGLTPITFLRQVLVLCISPKLLQDSRFCEDAKCRAKCILSNIKGSSLGACPHHQGLPIVRDHIADYISNRDNGIPCDPKNLFLYDGSACAIKKTLSLFAKHIDGKPTAVLLPVPHPPVYSAWLKELGLIEVGYTLNEKKNWTMNKKELENILAEAKCHAAPRAIVAINPGVPTGQVFSRHNITDIIKFAHKEKLFLIADEIYQENVYSEVSEFYSFKKVKHELGPPYDKMELASFLSASKGIYGECGLKGGCVEFDCVLEEVLEQVKRSISNTLGANTVGQVALSCMTKPPTEECSSFESYLREKCCILTGLMQKAKFVTDNLNRISGISMVPVEGGLYGYGKVEMTKIAVDAAKKEKLDPSELWCKNLLEKSGIYLTPDTAFGKIPNSHYFRMSFAQPFETLETVTEAIKKHQLDFMKNFKDK